MIVRFIIINLLLLQGFECRSQTENSGNIGRCLATTNYTMLKGTEEQKIYKPCAICFTDDVFSIYTSEYGTITFHIDQGTMTQTPSANGIVQSFMNEEDYTTSKMFYTVEITYSNPKVIVFTFTKFGTALVIKGDWIGGSVNNSTGKVAFSAMKMQQHKDSINSGFVYYPGKTYDYSKLQDKPFYHNSGCFSYFIAKEFYKNRGWFYKSQGWVENDHTKLPSDTGTYIFNMVIDSSGKMNNINFETSTNTSDPGKKNMINTLLINKKNIVFTPGMVQGISVSTKIRYAIHLPSDTVKYNCK